MDTPTNTNIRRQTASRIKEGLAGLCFLAALGLFIAFFSSALLPKREEHGSNWGAFLLEEKNSLDVIFFGSSLVYCDVIPAVIYDESGYSSYIMAGPEQTLPMTYYYIKETYRTQSPQAIFVEVSGAFYPEFTNYTKVNIGYMPCSLNRLAATFRTAEREERTGLLFPLYNYHELWNRMEENNTRYTADPLAGYSPLTDIEDITALTVRAVDFKKDTFENNIEYLRKIALLAEKKGSQLIFFIAPSYFPWESAYLALLEEELALIPHAAFIDFNANFDELGIDDQMDFFDVLHFNISGAQKFSLHLAAFIQELPLGKKKTDNPLLWQERVVYFRKIKGASK